MLTQPAISDDAIIACLHAAYGLDVAQVAFMPIGWVNNAVYRVSTTGGIPYFLKLRWGACDAIAVAVPATLHGQGIRRVMAPLATTTGELWVHAHDCTWILYPFFDGQTGFQAALSSAQWIALGATMQAVHHARLPPALHARVPQETFSPRWRDILRAFDQQIANDHFADPIAARLAAFWQARRTEIATMVARAEQLAQALQARPLALSVCHTDLHAGNVLVAAGDELAIVDWDEPILAPKERDLMFIGGGVGGTWNTGQEAGWFYQGYGQTEVDLLALCYYRYERIVVDIAEYATRIFGLQGSVAEREQALELRQQFFPNNVVDIAHRTYHLLLAQAPGSGFLT